MSKVFTTEITSDQLPSDNPLHQRLLKAYVAVEDYIMGDVLEVGCGEGRGVERVMKKAKSYTAIDKIEEIIDKLKIKYPEGRFLNGNIPPFEGLESNSYDTVISFQVIEHIQDDEFFLKEINRVLKPGGKAYLTTPNRIMSLTRNPWHIREYTAEELLQLAQKCFTEARMKGISGDEKVMAYYERNKKSVEKIARLDFLNLQNRLPAGLYKIPYELLNRWNRNKLKDADDELVASITHENYPVTEEASTALDLFLFVEK
ncbi:MAG TPA: class I SAM-dependent methyltransferase [Cyclobacteriaceae bacterium]|nr:class I SAM-dependent methyltransferase [Cyclobacteriaceae bacterium]